MCFFLLGRPKLIICLTSRLFEKIEGGGGLKLNKPKEINIIKFSENFGKLEFFDTEPEQNLDGIFKHIYIYLLCVYLSSNFFKNRRGWRTY